MLKEVAVSKALEKEIQPDGGAVISIDAYNGCQLQCPYCFQMNNAEWSKDIQVRTNIAEALKKELHSLKESHTEFYIQSIYNNQGCKWADFKGFGIA